MLHKIIYTIFVINIWSSCSDGMRLLEYNETNLVLAIKSELHQINSELKNQRQIKDDRIKEVETKFIAELQNQQGEIEKLGKSLEAQANETELKFKAELQNQQGEIEKLRESLETQANQTEFKFRSEQQNQQQFRLEGDREVKSLRREVERLIESFKLSKLSISLIKSYPINCVGVNETSIIEIAIPTSHIPNPFKVVCESMKMGGGWTVILHRYDGSVNFNRNWAEYKKGFGNLNGEFFLGLDHIHAITAERSQELLVVLGDFKGNVVYVKYSEFGIGDEEDKYRLHTLVNPEGTAKDALDYHQNNQFSTFDHDNDRMFGNCAETKAAGWWFNGLPFCHYSLLTGTYNSTDGDKGVVWLGFNDRFSVKVAFMAVRPRKSKH